MSVRHLVRGRLGLEIVVIFKILTRNTFLNYPSLYLSLLFFKNPLLRAFKNIRLYLCLGQVCPIYGSWGHVYAIYGSVISSRL